ncbi:MAG TPA: HD domain-containing phosphohydrolase [Anaerolineaceae bacterium]
MICLNAHPVFQNGGQNSWILISLGILCCFAILVVYVLYLRSRQRKFASSVLRSRNDLLRIVDYIPDFSWTLEISEDGNPHFSYLSPAAEKSTGYPVNYLIKDHNWLKTIHPTDLPRIRQVFQNILTAGIYEPSLEYRCFRPDGTLIWNRMSLLVEYSKGGKARIHGVIKDITESKQAYLRLAVQYDVIRQMNTSEPLSEVIHRLMTQVCDGLQWDLAEAWQPNPHGYGLICAEIYPEDVPKSEDFRIISLNAVTVPGIGLVTQVMESGEQRWIADILKDPNYQRKEAAMKLNLHGAYAMPVDVQGKIEYVLVFYTREILKPDKALAAMFQALSVQIKQYVASMLTNQAMQQSETRNRALLEAIPDLMFIFNENGIFLDQKSSGHNLIKPPEEFIGKSASEVLPPALARQTLENIQKTLETGKMQTYEYSLDELAGLPRQYYEVRMVPFGKDKVVTLVRDVTRRVLADEEIHRQLEQIQALRQIDQAISASLDENTTLSTGLDQVIRYLRVDATDILMYNKQNHTLEYVAGKGFRYAGIEKTRLIAGQGHAGRALLEGKVVRITVDPAQPTLIIPLLAKENFLFYTGIPLITRGQTQGVLEVFNRQVIDPDPEWMDFLQALAAQIAIAVDNIRLFSGLKKSNLDLIQAYDSTLEGWARALELRDYETQGHTRRVADFSAQLATRLSFDERQILQVRRGALLHDIGKIGIPDSILRKPGALTEEEWVIMRMHPLYAYQMLEPIDYLSTCLDIPHYHHERWDGSGYPDGLAGEQIPRAARLFSVVDAFDALTSDRPYRPAWRRQDAIEYILRQSGKSFDPQIVEVFLAMLQEEEMI